MIVIEPYVEIITCPECGQELILTITMTAVHRRSVTVNADFSDIREHVQQAHAVVIALPLEGE